MKKNLIVYASNTGNTEKIAIALKENFDRYGWQSTLKKLPHDYDVERPDFDFDDYDFVCVGSPINSELPLPQVSKVMTSRSHGMHKIVPGPKCGIVFCTYGGVHLGPKEAEPALKLLEVELEHLKFSVIGSLAVPGAMGDRGGPDWYYPDLRSRPNKEDLLNVGRFVDNIIKKLG
ncbi:MAG: flavodoxin domain-containing protein [Desulfobacterales bacterium]|nr:flavodoxin domain-containing protein [Desulfobacterales bacterium]